MKQPEQKNILKKDSTLFSEKQAVYCTILILSFFLILLIYLALHKISMIKPEIGTVTVENNYCSLVIPQTFYGYTRTGSTIRAFSSENPEECETLLLHVQKNPELEYSALNSSSISVANKLRTLFRQNFGSSGDVVLRGKEIISLHAGTSAIHFFFSEKDYCGEGIILLYNDMEVLCAGRYPQDIPPDSTYINKLIRQRENMLTMKQPKQENFQRPVVDSSHITFEEIQQKTKEAKKMLTLAKMYSRRHKDAPAPTALVSALQHYQKAFQLFSSLDQNEYIYDKENYEDFRNLQKQRTEQLQSMQLQYEREFNMKNYKAAAEKAQELMKSTSVLQTEAGIYLQAQKLAGQALNLIPQEDGEEN